MGETREVTVTVPESVANERVDRFLSEMAELNLTRNRIQRLIAKGLITVNGQAVPKRHEVVAGDVIALVIPPPPPREALPEDIPLDVVFEDEHLAVINKPAGMISHPALGHHEGTLVNALVHRYGTLAAGSAEDRPGIVHRLDRDTSGLLMVARNDEVYLKLQKRLQAREIHREYIALVCGHLKEEEGTIEASIGRSLGERTKMAVDGIRAREAVTHYRLKDRFRSYDLLEVRLETGRTHQIRVHLAHVGHPVFGDPLYGGRESWHRGMFAPERPLSKRLLEVFQRQALHAFRLGFTHPVTGAEVHVEAKVPEDFALLLETLNREGR